jgi:hypothetical protein
MFPFCPDCGAFLDQEQVPGQAVVCACCGQRVGICPVPQQAQVVDPTEELIRSGAAARCPLCGQLVELRERTTGKVYVPHYAAGSQKMCPGGGKPLAAPAASPPEGPPGGKDLRALMTRDVIRVVLCPRAAAPQIEELTLEYLDKSDRVRTQIEALRELLGPAFRMKPYPPPLNRPQLAVWGDANACVVARKHPQGGFEPMADAELALVVTDLAQHRQLFFA